MKYSDHILNLDIERIKELVIIKLQYFFHDNKIAKIILLLSASLLLWQSYLLYSLYNNYKNWQLPKVEQIYRVNNKLKTNTAVNIISKHMFGAVARPGGSLADAVKTALPIILKGVISNNGDSKTGQAIIQTSDGKQKVYSIGDKLQGVSGNVVLEHIYKEKVYVKNNGNLEYVLYPVIDLSNTTNKSTSNSKFSSTNSTTLNRNSNAPAQSIFGPDAGANEPAVQVPAPMSQEDMEEQEADERSDLPNNNNILNSPKVESLNRRLRNRPRGANNPDRINNQVKRIYN